MKTLIKSILIIFIFIIFFVACDDDGSKNIINDNKDSSHTQYLNKEFTFSNYNWKIKETKDFADSRIFCLTNKKNVSLNNDGSLVLKISKIGEYWYGGELTIDTTLGFGEYSFEIYSPQNSFDANANLSLTILNLSDENYEGLTQTGIRFSKNSDIKSKNELEYFLYSTDRKIAGIHIPEKPFLINNKISVHKIGIYPDYIYYTSKSGNEFNEFKTFKKNNISGFSDDISFAQSTGNLKVIISLCLADANEPVSNKDVEVVIKKFKFSPAADDITLNK